MARRRRKRRRRKRTFHYSYRTEQVLEGGVPGYTHGCKQFKARTRLGAAAQVGAFVAGDFTTRRGGSLENGPCLPRPDGVGGGGGGGNSWEYVAPRTDDEPSALADWVLQPD